MTTNGDEQQKGSRSRIANYQKILANNPRSFIFAQLAEEHLKLGELDQAIEICQKGLQYNPDFSDGLYVLGVALFKKDLKDNAIKLFLSILRNQPDHYLAGEAMHRMDYTDEQIKQMIADGLDGRPEETEEELSLLGVVPEDEEVASAAASGKIRLDSRHAPSEAAQQMSARRGVPSAAGDIRSAIRPGVDTAELDDEEPASSEPRNPWLKVAALGILIVLALVGYFVYAAYEARSEREAVAILYMEADGLLKQDSMASQREAIRKLEQGVEAHPKAIHLKAMLVEAYARSLIDFDPDDLDWKARMEALFATFPPGNMTDSDLLSAQAYRSFYLNQPGDVRFLVDTAGEKGLLTPGMTCLDGELSIFDRRYPKALLLFDEALADDPALLRAQYRKALTLIETGNLKGAQATLELLLEQQPDHLRGKILLWEARIKQGDDAKRLQQEVNDFAAVNEAKLPSIPLARLLYVLALLNSQSGDTATALGQAERSVSLHATADSLFLLAKLQFAAKRYDEAKDNALQAAALNPDMKDYHAFLGRLYFLEDHKTEALRQMEMAIDDSTDALDLLVMAGDAASKLRMYDKAVQYYERASFVNFQNLDLKKKLILTYIEKQDMKDAKRRIEKLLLEQYDQPITHFLNGRYLLAEGERAKARKAFMTGLSRDAKNRELLFELARLDIREKNMKAGFKRLRRLVELYPEDVEALGLLADFAFAADARATASELYKRLDDLRPQIRRYRLRLAFLDYLAGESKAAHALVEKELARNPDLAYGHILRGIFLLLENDPKRAEAQIQKGIQLNSKNPEGHFWLGRIKREAGDHTWAVNEFDLTLECQPVYPKADFEIADIHFLKGEYDQAKERYLRALDVFSLFSEEKDYQVKIYTRLGEIDIVRNRVRQGLKLVRQASKMDPTAAEPYYILARDAIDKYSNARKTIGLLNKALELDPKLAPAHYELGLMYMARDRNKEAANQFRRYLKIEPKGRFAQDARQKLDNLLR